MADPILTPPELTLEDVCRTACVAPPPKRRTTDVTDAEIEQALAEAFPSCPGCGEDTDAQDVTCEDCGEKFHADRLICGDLEYDYDAAVGHQRCARCIKHREACGCAYRECCGAGVGR